MNFLNASFKVGELFGINIRVHILFLFWIAFRMFDATSRGSDWKLELSFLAMLFGIVLLHEFGHCFGARTVGGDAQNILMWPLGGLAYAHAPMRPWPQFVTVAAGPAVNVAFCLISAGVMFIVAGGKLSLPINPLGGSFAYGGAAPLPAWFIYAFVFYKVNLFLLGLNLLPIFPLDGGQLFHAIIWPFVGLQRASIIACQVGLVGCVMLGLLGLRGGGGMLVFIAIFGGYTCWQRLQAVKMGWLQEDSPYETYGASHDPRPWYRRIFKMGPRKRKVSAPVEFPNPNPGGWAEKQTEREKEDAELDRLLKKVSEHGVQSLSYVDRQKLERITRARQSEQQRFERSNRG